MAGLQTIRPLRAIDQRVAIPLLDPVEHKILLGKNRIEIRIGFCREIADQRRGQNIQVARRGELFGIGPAGGITENRIIHPECPRHIVHFFGKPVFGP